jgi:poly(ADP-ribose) glycohydrolase
VNFVTIFSDCKFRVKRGGSTGFALREDSLDENFLQDSLQQERQWIDKFKSKQSGLSRKESNKSSEYSFSTEYSSELEEVYEQFSRWLQNPILERKREQRKSWKGGTGSGAICWIAVETHFK